MRRPRRYTPIDFLVAKRRLLDCLARDDIQHEPRDAMAEKNLLAVKEAGW